MTEGNASFESRTTGGLIVAATMGAVVLVLHHPTSINGVDDGTLLHDWSNSLVHGAMMLCLFTLMIAFTVLARHLGEDRLEIRAGALAFSGGMIAMIAASFINGFVVGGLQATTIDSVVADDQFAILRVLNQKLALLGIVMISVSMTFWAIRFVRQDGLTRIAGWLGIALALFAGYWLLTGNGIFGLHVAMVSMIAFSTWALIIAMQLFRGKL